MRMFKYMWPSDGVQTGKCKIVKNFHKAPFPERIGALSAARLLVKVCCSSQSWLLPAPVMVR